MEATACSRQRLRAAAGLWILSVLALRVFSAAKKRSSYWRNGFFWVKVLLFAIVFVLELAPMMTVHSSARGPPRLTAAAAVPPEAVRQNQHRGDCAGGDNRLRRGVHGSRRVNVDC